MSQSSIKFENLNGRGSLYLERLVGMELNIAEGQVIYIKRLSSKEKVPMFLIKKMLAHGYKDFSEAYATEHSEDSAEYTLQKN